MTDKPLATVSNHKRIFTCYTLQEVREATQWMISNYEDYKIKYLGEQK